eukprot:713191-Amorphochlora_amoeboformis.AAC.1
MIYLEAGTTGYYPALPGKYYRQDNLRAISGISTDLQLSVVYVRLYFNTLSISTLRDASICY